MKSLHIFMMNKKATGLGYLYNWYAASDSNFAPTDWKVPTSTEYVTLEDYLESIYGAGKAGDPMKSTDSKYWLTPNNNDNLSGFSAYGSGYRTTSFASLKEVCFLWTQSESTATNGTAGRLLYNDDDFAVPQGWVKYIGGSIRLLYTGTGSPTTVTDNDGNVYDVVQIGTQYWTVQNWKCTTLDNGTAIPNVTDDTTWSGLTTLGRCAYNNDENNV